MQLAALNSVELRSLLLEERKAAPQYKAVFGAAPAAMEVDNKDKQPENTDATSAPDEDFVHVTSADTSTLAPAKGTDANRAAAAAAAGRSGAAKPQDEAVKFKLVPEYKEVAAGPTSLKVVISLQATSEVAKPANVALVAVVDKSGSMGGSKMALVKDTVDFLAEQLGSQDAWGLVTYSDLAKRDLPLVAMTPAAKTLAKAVNAGVTADGCTALLDGLSLGLKEHSTDAAAAAAAAAAGGAAEGVKRRVRSVFLCTDGLPNVGPSDAPSIVSAMRAQLTGLAAAEQPVSVHTFGFGADHDARLLQAIAEAGHGIYYFIQDDSQIPEAFGDALGGLLSVVASSVRVTITPLAADGSSSSSAASCSIVQLQHGGSQDTPAGATGVRTHCQVCRPVAEESREVLLQLGLAAAAGEGQQALVQVEVSFTHPETGAVSSSSQVLQLARAAAPAAGQARDPLVAATAARFQVAEALKAAAAESEANRFAAAEQQLQQAQAQVEAAEWLGGARQAYIAQLADMANHIRAVQFSSQHEQRMASTRMAACSNSMAKQRSAGVGFTSAAAPVSYAAAPAPRSRNAALPPPAFLSGAPGAAPGSAAAAADVMQQQQDEAVPWSKSSAMRKKMTASATDYVSKRNMK
uniref:VWFA domain-containing protein n=1 Tax=Tetradesmus obliquus TaxID=3088 RepID=A0A383VXD5_TETOB|eukprot:jgi/Sobl393_1/11963/SZX70138.1